MPTRKTKTHKSSWTLSERDQAYVAWLVLIAVHMVVYLPRLLGRVL